MGRGCFGWVKMFKCAGDYTSLNLLNPSDSMYKEVKFLDETVSTTLQDRGTNVILWATPPSTPVRVQEEQKQRTQEERGKARLPWLHEAALGGVGADDSQGTRALHCPLSPSH